jgi:hypothetical protein
MRERKCLRFALGAGLLLLLAAAAPGSAAKAPAAGQCASAQAWAWVDAQHGQLPSTSEDLARYPVPQRMAILASLDAQTRSRIWREHFQRHLDRDANLTSAQRAVLEDALALFSPELFAAPAERRSGDDLPALLERAKDAFGRTRGIALLTVIDPNPTPVPVTPNCACATSPGDTCATYCDDTEVCTPSRRGCGPGGVYACNGMCAPPPSCSCTTAVEDNSCGEWRYCYNASTCGRLHAGCGPGGAYPCDGVCEDIEVGPADPVDPVDSTIPHL